MRTQTQNLNNLGRGEEISMGENVIAQFFANQTMIPLF